MDDWTKILFFVILQSDCNKIVYKYKQDTQ